jgi:hypothetical protein
MQGRDSVRDVIAFPKNSNGEDPMVQSPGPVDHKQLEDYHLKVVSRDSNPKQPEERLEHLVNMIAGKTEGLQSKDGSGCNTTTAVMVDDDEDKVKSGMISLLKSLEWNDSIAGFYGAVGESILIALRLEKATPEEVKRNATMWGLSVEQLEELVRLHQSSVAEKLDKAREDMNAKENGERPSDPGNLSDAVQPPR